MKPLTLLNKPNIQNNLRGNLFSEYGDYKVFRTLMDELETYLRKKRKPFLHDSAEALVRNFEKDGVMQSRMFYFTEVDGRIYSVATNSPAQQSERLAEESEKVINSLKSRVRPTQRASK